MHAHTNIPPLIRRHTHMHTCTHVSQFQRILFLASWHIRAQCMGRCGRNFRTRMFTSSTLNSSPVGLVWKTVEYNDWISAEGLDFPLTSVLDMILKKSNDEVPVFEEFVVASMSTSSVGRSYRMHRLQSDKTAPRLSWTWLKTI